MAAVADGNENVYITIRNQQYLGIAGLVQE